MTDETYKCEFCGKQNVKLWRPYQYAEPLVCAVCAEERQTPKYNSKGQELPKREVNSEGRIPFFADPILIEEYPTFTTDQLHISLIDGSGGITMIPAVPHEDGGYWSYTAVPEDLCNWWKELPTK